MKNLYILLTFVLVSIGLTAQTPNWAWVKSESNNGTEQIRRSATDGEGNTYVVGIFKEASITFGTTTLTNINPSFYEIFIVKYDGSGNVLWAKTIAHNSHDDIWGIAIDAENNFYLSGVYGFSPIVFGNDTLQANTSFQNTFMVKYNSSGTPIWAKRVTGTGKFVCVDLNQNVYITGHYYMGTGIFGNDTLPYSLDDNIYVAKYNSLGNLQWAKGFAGRRYDNAQGIAVGHDGNVYVTGSFSSDTLSFGTNVFVNHHIGTFYTYDSYLIKLDANGNLLWAKQTGGTDDESGRIVLPDQSGNVYNIGGFSSNSVQFGSNTLANCDPSCLSSDAYIVKYDAAGNVLWAKGVRGDNSDGVAAAALDKFGYLYVAGGSSSLIVEFGTAQINYPISGGNILVAKYAPWGENIWAKGLSNDSWAYGGVGITTDIAGNVVVAGNYAAPSFMIDTTTLTNFNSTSQEEDIFIAKILSQGVGIDEIDNLAISIYPNPTSNQFTIKSNNTVKSIRILNLLGELINAPININNNYYSIDISNECSGIYLVEIQTENGIAFRKVSKE
jgi:hypothetical protein